MSNCVFNFNILALVVFELLGGSQIYVMGSVPPVRPYGKHFCARSEYFTMSNGIFNFNFLPLVFSEILGGPKFTLGALRPLDGTYRRNFFTKSEYFTISNCVFNFNILTPVVSEILGGSQIYVRGPCAPPLRPLEEIVLYPRRVRYYV